MLSVAGRLEHADNSTFKAALDDAASRTGKNGALIVDLAGLERIGSGGLRMLVLCQRTMASRDSRLVVAGMTGFVREAFSISQIDQILDTAPTASEALQLSQ